MFLYGINTLMAGSLVCFLCLGLQFEVWSHRYPIPSAGDFDTCKLTAEQKERFLHEHNKFRGMVNPSAADMEKLVWDDDLANLAQMWVNRCIWQHGFMEFGNGYPNHVNFTGEQGQSLVQEAGKINNLEHRLEEWYLEYKKYTFSKFTKSSVEPSGHYTQIIWAKTKYIGCAVKWCPNMTPEMSTHGQGVTLVACDYSPPGNVLGQYPYQIGPPCTKCASGKTFCYNKLCTETPEAHVPESPAPQTQHPKAQHPAAQHPEAPPKEIPHPEIAPPTVTAPAEPEPITTCSADKHSGCERWAAVGECEKNAAYMIANCCFSCKYHMAPKDCVDSTTNCLLWAHDGQCNTNREWMSKNCRKSCNVCGDCKDTDLKQCPSWALLGQCSSGDRKTWMNTNCRKSCGLCKVYDRHKECSAWAAMNECKKSNWAWMEDHCPRSCEVPFSEASFCGEKTNGNYQAPNSCESYMACSNGVTSHVACPAGKKFDTVKRFCEPADRAICRVLVPSKSWKMIATL